MTPSAGTPSELPLPSPKERRRLREAVGLSLDDVAASLGVSASTVRSWETGRTSPRGHKRQAYARILGTDTDTGTHAGTDSGTDTGVHTDAGSRSGTGTDPHTSSGGGTGTAWAWPGLAHDTADLPAALRAGGEGLRAAFTAGGAGRPAAGPPVDAGPAFSPAGLPARPGSGDRPPAPGRHASEIGPESLPDPAPAQAPATGTGTGTNPAPDPRADGHPEATTGPPDPDPDPARPRRVGRSLNPVPPEGGFRASVVHLTPGQAFDALYAYAAPSLVRQTYLLTGRRTLARQSVERAFRRAWERWPEVATDPDPVGWVRAAAYEWALSPWHVFRRPRKHPDKTPADPADRILMDALLALRPRHRRTVLLYDGVGLDLPDTAAETEASTPAAGARLLRAHAELAHRVPELVSVPASGRSAVLHEQLCALRPAVRLEPCRAVVVRMAGERRSRLWTRAALTLTACIAAATTYTLFTAPTRYVPRIAPGASVSGVPPHAGPQHLTEERRLLQEKLRTERESGPARLLPRVE
ncbi:helix-turn-helix domain-containing protein [Streptomyces sp. NPDC090022]|uniref:helix-turn-helix domain-containing protein n=1 Tax=Streptomyces sp. NPDC090022 TaxID=3365920 RepID=UPI003821EE79